jgi:hypothetical protein
MLGQWSGLGNRLAEVKQDNCSELRMHHDTDHEQCVAQAQYQESGKDLFIA